MARPIVVHADWDPEAAVWVATTQDIRGLVTEADSIELLRAVRDVARGKRYLAGDVAQQLALGSLSTHAASPFDALSPRELEIVMLLVRGQRMTEIGTRLSLSAKTVATHKYNAFAKLGVKDLSALTRLAMQHGLMDPAQA